MTNMMSIAEMGLLLGTEGVKEAVTNYTAWYAISSVGWILFSILLIIFAIMFWRKREKICAEDFFDMPIPLCFFVSLAIMGIGSLLFFSNLPTIFQPKAYAIHKLIQEIR